MYSIQTSHANTQNQLLLNNLMEFYKNKVNMDKMKGIINGDSKISLRIVDWFVTNFAKKHYTVYELPILSIVTGEVLDRKRFKVFNDYKLKLKAYSKRRFDPFCRWERISVPYDDKTFMETTIGQLNFFKWAIEHKIIDFIENNYKEIESDMNCRNSTSKVKEPIDNDEVIGKDVKDKDNSKTRKKREELSISACKCIKKEEVQIIVKFDI